MSHVALFFIALAAWTINTLSAGGGSLLLVAALNSVFPTQQVPQVVSIASLIASPGRIAFSWRHINWRVARWYWPGSLAGVAAGAWIFAHASAAWLGVAVGIVLTIAGLLYRPDRAADRFNRKPSRFVPVSFAVGLVSAIVGASGLLANPVYLNYGLVKEEMLATRAINSLVIQVAKIASYAALGLLNPSLVGAGLVAGAGTLVAIALSRLWLDAISPLRFRQLARLTLLTAGVLLLWRHRAVLQS